MLLTDLLLLSEVLARTPPLESQTESRPDSSSENSGAHLNSVRTMLNTGHAPSVVGEGTRSIAEEMSQFVNPLDANDVSDSEQYQGCRTMCRNVDDDSDDKSLCRAYGPEGYICTLEPGHYGNHEAYGTSDNTGEIYETWPQDPPNKEELSGYMKADTAAWPEHTYRGSYAVPPSNVYVGGKLIGEYKGPDAPKVIIPLVSGIIPKEDTEPVGLPTDDKTRKEDYPLYSFMFGYFPDSWLAVVRVAVEGNKQHNPGQPLHWAREKSKDQMNTAWRHQWDYGRGVKKDTDGQWHLAKAIWRLSAQLQLDIEEERRQNGDK